MPDAVFVGAMIYLVLYKSGKGNIERCFNESKIKSGHYGF